MRYLKRSVLRFLLLNKRLFCRLSFVLILLAVPLMVLAVGILSSGQNGIVTVVLAEEDPDDPISSEAIASLLTDDSGVARFRLCATPAEAEDDVRYGRADGAWIFGSDLESAIERFIGDQLFDKPFIRVVEREETVGLQLVREMLSGVMSKYICSAMMVDYVRENVPELDGMSDGELLTFIDDAYAVDKLFEFSYIDGSEPTDDIDLDILMLPIRGLLSVLVVLAGLAAALFYMQDESSMAFYRLRRGERPLFAALYHATGVLDVGLSVLVALFLSGVYTDPGREIVSMAVYCAAVVAFVILIRRLCGTPGRLGTVTPILTVALIAVSPIFFSLSWVLRPVQLMTPTYYYLMSIHRSEYLGYMALYAAAVFALDYAIYKLTDRA